MYRTDPLFNGVLATVLGVHLLLIAFCFMTNPFRMHPKKFREQKLTVQTIKLSPSTLAPPSIPSSSSALPSTPSSALKQSTKLPESKIVTPATTENKIEKANTKSVQQKIDFKPTPQVKLNPKASTSSKTEPKAPTPSKVVSKASTPAKVEAKPLSDSSVQPTSVPKKNSIVRQHLLSKVKQNLGQIKTQNLKQAVSKSTDTASLSAIDKLQTDAFSTSESLFGSTVDGDYRDELTSGLKRALQLPGYGNVTIELTLMRSGKIKSFKVIKTENAENSRYIEKTIANVSFPSFGESFKGMSEHTFLIILTNE